MRCATCGLEYGLTHNCPGAIAPAVIAEPVAPTGFAVAHYLRLGWEIATWNDQAVQRAARDPRALYYGIGFFVIAAFLQVILALALAPRLDNPLFWVIAVASVPIGIALEAAYQLGRLWVCHALTRVILGGKGTFVGVLRPLAVSSFLLGLVIIPFVGPVIAGAWWGIGVPLNVFEEIHGVERMKTLALLIGINLVIIALLWATPFNPFLRMR